MSEASLQGKIAIVTGAASNIGLGRAMTLALVHGGARVAMVDVDQIGLEESAAVAEGAQRIRSHAATSQQIAADLIRMSMTLGSIAGRLEGVHTTAEPAVQTLGDAP